MTQELEGQEQWEGSTIQLESEYDYVIRALSTRPVKIEGDDFVTSIARTALEDAADQVNSSGLWINEEHLGFMPPQGICSLAEVVDTEDNEADLILYGTRLPLDLAANSQDLLSGIADLPRAECPDLSASVAFCRRNFDPEVVEDIIRESDGKAHPTERHSELPLLEISIYLSVVWGAKQFFGSFLKKLGESAGEALAAKVKSWAKRSKEPDRPVIFCIVFELSDGSEIEGFVVSTLDELETRVDSALNAAEQLAAFAGLQNDQEIIPNLKKAVYFCDDGQWHLGWFTDGSVISCTEWFLENRPDVDELLGR